MLSVTISLRYVIKIAQVSLIHVGGRVPGHLLRYPPARRLTPAFGAAALLLLSGVLAGTAAHGTLSPRPPAAHRLAYDEVTGRTVTVYKPTGSTPVRPETITHPGADGMDTGVAAPVSQAPQAGPAVEDAVTTPADPPGLSGIDVSDHQGSINWSSVAPHVSFVYAKATEGAHFMSPSFAAQYDGPYDANRIRGAYHLAIPSNSGGAAQADFFAHHGGGWSADGLTLPGALDIESNPYGSECYGLSRSQMTDWIWSFVHEYAYDTGVYPVIYTTYGWWRTCTGNASGFQNYDPLWIACYCSHSGSLPSGYGFYTFWQYSDSGRLPGDQDVFNGSAARLEALARG